MGTYSTVPVKQHDPVARLGELFRGKAFAVLTGAGCSTESGIPDYRGPETHARVVKPMMYSEFVGSERARRRYWARSLAGFQRVASAKPNKGHVALAQMEAGGLVSGLITQNVDGLHHAAGSQRIIELHGRLSEVGCLNCGAIQSRARLQNRMQRLNPGWSTTATRIAPDGDSELALDSLEGFNVPACPSCGGVLKPNVVFFGENVPKHTVTKAMALIEKSEAVLIAGSSLTVYSGYRFVLRAAQLGLPIAIVNIGPSRADNLAALKLEHRTGMVLPALASVLLGENRSFPGTMSISTRTRFGRKGL